MSRRSGFLAFGFLTTIIPLAGWARPTLAEPLQNTNALWVADRHSLLKFSPQGSPLLSITAAIEVTSLATDPLSGAVWVGGRNALSKYAFDGSLLLHLRLAGPDSEEDDDDAEKVRLAMDPVQGRPWAAAGRVVVGLEADGRERFRRIIAEEIVAIAYNGRTRQAWVATEHEILLFGEDGALLATLALRDLDGVRIATDSTQGTTWVASGRLLLKYDGADQQVLRVRLSRETRDLAVNSQTGEVWVTEKSAVVKLSAGGQVLLRVRPFDPHGDEDETQPRHLAVDPSTGSLWVASEHSLALVNGGGAVLSIPARFRQIRALAFFADLVPPKLEIVFPPADAFLPTNIPTLKLRYSDPGSGVDPASLKVKVDGQDVTSTCGPVEGGSDCLLNGVVTLADGLHTVHARVADRAGNVTEASSSFTVDTIPPATPDTALIDVEPTHDPNQWQVVGGPGSVEALSTVRVRNTRTGASVFVTAGADGSFSVTLAAQQGDVFAITATDRAGNTSAVAEKLLPPAPRQTQPSGFIHGVALDAKTRTALAGIRVSMRGSGAAVFTDASGRFVFPTTGTGFFTLFFERRGYVTARRDQYVLSERHATVGEVGLTPLSTRTSLITAAAGGTLTDPTGKVQALFPAGAVTRDLQVSATYFGSEAEFPLPVPEGTVFLAAAQMTPEHTSFLKPVKLRFANTLGFAPGTPIPFAFASHDPEDTNEGYYDPGMATVTADGAFIELQVKHFSCVTLGAAPPPGTSTGNGSGAGTGSPGNQNPGNGNSSCGLSSICISDGAVRTEQRLASVGALGGRDTLDFVYSSDAAFPRPVIQAHSKLSSLYFPTAPLLSTWKLSVEGVDRDASFQGSVDETHLNYLWDGVNASGARVPTGAYHFKATSTGYFTGNLYTADTFNGLPTAPTNVQNPRPLPYKVSTGGYVMFNDQSASAFGAGWGLAELERLHPQPDGTVLWAAGTGASMVFTPGAGLSTKQVLKSGLTQAGGLARDAAGNLYVGEFNGTISKIAPDGTSSVFAGVAQGLSSLAFDQAGNLYALHYGGLLSRINAAGQSTPIVGFGGDLGDLAVDAQGDIFILDSHHPKIWKVTPDGQAAIFAGYDLFAGNRLLTYPSGIALDRAGNLYVSNNYNVPSQVPPRCGVSFISKISPQGAHSYYAVGLNAPRGMAFDADGNLYVADRSCTSAGMDIKVISTDGVITTMDTGYPAPVTGVSPPYGYSYDLVVGSGRKLYMVADNGTVYQTFGLGPPSAGVPVPYAGPAGDYSTVQRHADGSYTRILKDGTRIEFNAAGFETARVETTGNTMTYAYDGSGRLVSRTNAVGQTWQLAYSGGGLASVTDPAGRATLFAVDSSRDLMQVTHPDGSTVSFGYDARHLLTSKADARGFTTTYVYDAIGKAKEARVPTGETRRFDIGRVRTAANNLSGSAGTPDNPAPPVRGDDIEDRYTDGRGNVTRYLSNGFGSVTRVVRPDNAVQEIERDERNNPVQMKEPNGATVTQEFDSRGNLTKYDQAGGLLYKIQYHPAFSKPTMIENEGGRALLGYDERGNLIQIADPASNVTKFTVDSRGLVTEISRPDGGTIGYRYDSLGRVVELSDPLGRKTIFEYDAAGNVVRVTAPGNRVTGYTYDAMNRLKGVTDALGQTTSFAYEAACSGCDNNPALATSITDAKGHTTRFRYDEIGELTETVDSLGRKRKFAYDLRRNLASVTDAKGQTTTVDYDVNNRLIRVNRPDGPTDYGYDIVGNLLSLRDAQNAVRLEYDIANRLVRATPEGGLPALPLGYSYDRRNLRTSLGMPWGRVGYEYDARGDLKKLSGPAGNLSYAYDGVGRRESVSGLIGEVLSYDKAGQLTSRESRAGAIVGWSYGYDEAGNRASQELREQFLEGEPTIQVTPENGVALTETVILQGRTTPGGQILLNGFPIFVDFFGNFFRPLGVSPGLNTIELEARRPNGARAVKTIRFTGGSVPMVTRLFSADAAGSLYGLDQNGRAVSVSANASLSVLSGLDGSPSHVARGAVLYAWYGDVLKRFDPVTGQVVELGQLPFPPDDVALLPDETWLVGQGAVLYRFDPVAGSVVPWVTLPLGPGSRRVFLSVRGNGEVVAGTDGGQLFRVSAAGQVVELTGVLGLSRLDDVAVDEVGNAFCLAEVPQSGYEGLCSECPECDPHCTTLVRLSPSNQLTPLSAERARTSIAADRGGNLYLLDQKGLAKVPAGSDTAEGFLPSPKGLLIEVLVDEPSIRRKAFSYDALDQLTGATSGESYAYDAVGNRTRSYLSSTYRVDDANELIEDDSYTYAYDGNGNLAQRRHKATSSLTTYTWDSRDRLIRVALPDGTVAEYGYDPLGRRIKKTVNGQVTRYLYDGLDIVAELDASGNVTTTYVHGPQIDEPISMTRGGRSYTYHRDALGSITLLTDEAGAVVQRYDYDAYGNITAMLNPSFVQPYAFTGREWDPEIGLYYYRARYYDPRIGRFISEDSIRLPGGINFYAYVGNSPPNLRDPEGRNPVVIIVVGGALVLGGAVAYVVSPTFREIVNTTAEKVIYTFVPGGEAAEVISATPDLAGAYVRERVNALRNDVAYCLTNPSDPTCGDVWARQKGYCASGLAVDPDLCGIRPPCE